MWDDGRSFCQRKRYLARQCFGNQPRSVVNFIVGRETPKAETNRGISLSHTKTNGAKHMRRFRVARGAGGAGRSSDTRLQRAEDVTRVEPNELNIDVSGMASVAGGSVKNGRERNVLKETDKYVALTGEPRTLVKSLRRAEKHCGLTQAHAQGDR